MTFRDIPAPKLRRFQRKCEAGYKSREKVFRNLTPEQMQAKRKEHYGNAFTDGVRAALEILLTKCVRRTNTDRGSASPPSVSARKANEK